MWYYNWRTNAIIYISNFSTGVKKVYINIDGINIFYKKEGQGKKVLFLHGWGGNSNSFLPVFNALSKEFEVYAIDFPGFGRSDFPDGDWDVTRYMEITYKFLEKLGLEKVSIIAHSFGGRVAIMLAALHPEVVDKLVLVNSAGLIPKRGWKYYYRVYRFKLIKSLLLLLGKKDAVEKLYERYGSKDYKEAGRLRGTFVKVINQDLRGYLKKIKAPTLLIWGDKDRETPIEFAKIMEKEIPDAGLVVFENAGHFSYLERLNDFIIIVSYFLR